MRKATYIIPVIVIALAAILSSIFIVDEREKALVLQFGQIRAVKEDPGLAFKVPLIQEVVRYDDRILSLDTPPIEVTPSDDRRLVVDAFARYRIADVVQFRQAVGVGGLRAAEDRLASILTTQTRAVLGSAGVTANTFLSSDRAALMVRIRELAQLRASALGLDVVDVRLKQTNLPEQNLDATFARMRAEREREAADEIARGRAGAGEWVPLGESVSLSSQPGYVHLRRHNGRMSATVWGEVDEADPAAAAEVDRRVAEAMAVKPDHLLGVHQVHSADVLKVDAPRPLKPKADAMVTNRPGLALSVLTADCQPVLFADTAASVIGAAHAGWRGALDGVLEATLKAMEDLGADRSSITAIIGPSISQRAYEVGPEFLATFLDEDPENGRFFAGGEGDRLHFDLPGFGLARLRNAGVGHAEWIRHCTYFDPDRFYSYRRSVHQKDPDYGRLISSIRL